MSAKNRGFVKPLENVVVYSNGCATFDFPLELATNIKGTLAHPQVNLNVTNYITILNVILTWVFIMVVILLESTFKLVRVCEFIGF